MYIRDLQSSRDLSDTLDDPAELSMFYGLGPNPQALINVSFTLMTIGQLALLFLGATWLLSRSVLEQKAALGNVVVVVFLSSIPPNFLIYAAAIWNPHPPVGLCVAQAALVDGIGIMLASASLALAIDLLAEIESFRPSRRRADYLRTVLVTAPYIAFFAVFASALSLGVRHPDEVVRMPNDLACSLQNTPFSITLQIIIVLTLTTTLCLEVHAIVDTIRTRQNHNLSDVRRPRSPRSTSKAARILGFTCLQGFLLIVSALDVYLGAPGLHIVSIISQSLMPLGTFLAFGTTEECMRIWKSWISFAKQRLRPCRNPSAPILPLQVKVTIERQKISDEPIYISFDIPFIGSAKGRNDPTKGCTLRTACA